MPDFTFTSPDGKNYTVSGPEGATKEQAFGILQQQLSSGSAKQDQPATTAGERGKAAIEAMRPKLPTDDDGKPVPAPTLVSAAKAVGSSGIAGGALGAISPEILNSAAVAASFIPDVGPELATALRGVATAAATSRAAAATTGAISGVTSELAGQGAEAAGAPKSVAATARLAGGLIAPGGEAVVNAVGGPARTLYNAVRGFAGMEKSVPAAVAKATANLRGLEDAGVPQHALHATLQAGADADVKAAQSAGDGIMADARRRAAEIGADDEASARRVLDEGERNASKIVADARQRAASLNKVAQGRLTTASQILAKAGPELKAVGTQQELSDIGKQLQTKIGTEQQAALNARQNAYKQAQVQRDAVVQAKEAAGQTVGDTPAMKQLLKDINTKTLGTAAARKASGGLAPVTDQGTLRVYQNIKEAITNRRMQTGVDAAGNPTYQTFKTSFEALDQVRRKLGDVLANRDVEGYSAIGKSIAGKLYEGISKVQQEFVGEVDGVNLQKELQSTYHEGSQGLMKFGAGIGGKATAMDRIDPERFAADPQSIPKMFFSSQQSVKDLLELTGDPALVQNSARSYTAKSLQGMSSKQVTKWAASNSDWMREVPGLQKSVENYATKLQRIENTAGKVTATAERFGKEAAAGTEAAAKVAATERAGAVQRAGQVGEGSVAAQKRVLEAGEKAAGEAVKQAAAPGVKLQGILNGGERPEAIRDLLLNGKPEQTRLAARIAAGSPNGQQALEGSVRQLTAGMSEKTLDQQWKERIRPMLRDGKMLPPERLAQLERDVQRVLDSYKGKDKLSLAQRYIVGAISTAGNVSNRY
jgi:hypothetical protein